MMMQRRKLILLCSLASIICFGNGVWIHAKSLLAQVLIEQAWSEMLETGEPVRPWTWADFWPVARLQVIKNGRMLYVLSSASGESLAFGPGHVNGSALPATEGASAIAAHRDTHFKFLKDIQIGDGITIQRMDGQSVSYSVSHLQVVDSRQTNLMLDAEKNGLTLITCYPFDAVVPGGPERLLVELLPEEFASS